MIKKFETLQQLLEKYPKIEIGKAEDLTNFVPVNNLIPICRVKKTRRPTWACQCKVCKQYKVSTASQIKNANAPGCCGNVKNIIGQRFGKLIVLQQSKKRRGRNVFWTCRCDCGNICEVCSSELLNGDTQSCGCLSRNNSSHGELKIIQLLKDANISFITQKRITTGQSYKFVDFCVNYNNQEYFIEYDGKQHFLENCHFGDENETLETIQRRDKEKNQYCIDNNIPLIRIPYTKYDTLCLEDLLLETTAFRIN